jgi:uncharacterized tellurite resistance protein B-like protein
VLSWKKLLPEARRTPAADPDLRRRLATAVLLLETARADFERSPAELAVVRAELARSFGIGAAELEQLLGEAAQKADRSVSLHEYVATLNGALDAAAKQELLAMLWRVAYADDRVDAQEEHLIRRLADLLHVPHAAFIRQKLDAARR